MRKAKVVWHRDDDAVSPVIGTILMVAITVVLAAVLWLMVSGMISTSDEDKITVNLASPNVQKFDTRTAAALDYRWDATLNVNKITPKDQKVLWSEVKVIIKASSGSILNAATGPLTDLGAVYDTDAADGTVTVEFWFVETGGNLQMNAGDAIKVTGMADTYEGATLELTKAGERIGSATMPTNFP